MAKIKGRKLLEMLMNVAILVVAFILVYSFISSRFKTKPDGAPPVGSRLSLDGVTWQDSKSTLVIVLQKGCKYCAESAAFYRKLNEERGSQAFPRIVAVVPAADLSESSDYLQEMGIPADIIVNHSMSELNVAYTPTLLLVDGSGVIRERWIGKVPPEKEREVTSRILHS
jgi:hypothetical protein